nr:16S rRNA (guanine(966)-N(2))-methyltransferase RsmD [uncultured Porphyromonas sp.]
MRIIGGKYKRRRFDVPKSFNARPTTDFAKENLFNVLQHYIDLEGTTALDLFSGTGSIAVELLSRGVSRVVALEQRREHASFIRLVARELGEETHLQVLQADVFRFLRGGKTQPIYDFIFADPPYKLSEIAQLPELIFGANLLREGGLLVVEHPQQYDFSSHPHFTERRVYGSVNFSLFSLAPELPE